VITVSPRSAAEPGRLFIFAASTLFFAACTLASYARWANFDYRTFDLAYYVQAIWQLIHGRFVVSVEHVPLLGNHAEPIVFLFAPIFAIFRHPLVFVVIQNATLAVAGPVAYRICRSLGFDDKKAGLLAAALLLAPAAGYIALHEFHPEAFVVLFVLLMLQARLSRKLGWYWLWFVAVLACKENMALLLAGYCAVHCVTERDRGFAEVRRWFLWPMGLSILWFGLYTKWIMPALNSGNIDYLALYDRLGSTPAEILWNAAKNPQLIVGPLAQSLTHGNLVWALLLPFLGFSLLRPRWLIVCLPVLLQHLLSWRSSEWTIYFHYAAPLLPLFWIALVEALAQTRRWPRFPEWIPRHAPALIVITCVAFQVLIGPAPSIAQTATTWFAKASERTRKNDFISAISPQASVVAPLPYLSHLAMREKLYSLHYILKGLKTLSRATYEPPASTDFVLIDYRDSATFDASSGYYHPVMQMADGRIIPSSDRLLHDFLKRASWNVKSVDELTLFRKSGPTAPAPLIPEIQPIAEIGAHTQLLQIERNGDVLSPDRPVDFQLRWRFQGERDVIPWMLLRLTSIDGPAFFISRGLCAPETEGGSPEENWRITFNDLIPPGDYLAEAIFLDNSKRAWSDANGQDNLAATLLSKPISLGSIRVETGRR
jgi:uncharacterized membrane protein